jgi:predicted RecA/RadA family phage recombinase
VACKGTLFRGTGNAQNNQYAETVANYGSTASPTTSGIVLEGMTSIAGTSVGDWVYLDSGTVTPAIATTKPTSRIIGVCIAKPTATTADVQTAGITPSVFAGLTLNENYFLSEVTAGAQDLTPPTGSGEIIMLLGRAISTTQMIIELGEPLERR